MDSAPPNANGVSAHFPDAGAQGKLALMERLLLAVERGAMQKDGRMGGHRRGRAYGSGTYAEVDEQPLVAVGGESLWGWAPWARGRGKQYSELDDRLCFSQELADKLKAINEARPQNA